jgi:hypothetical protein
VFFLWGFCENDEIVKSTKFCIYTTVVVLKYNSHPLLIRGHLLDAMAM